MAQTPNPNPSANPFYMRTRVGVDVGGALLPRLPACLPACLCFFVFALERIWRTSHRYRDWLALKERLRKEYGTRNLPDDRIFPKKENLVSTATPVGVLL